MDSRTDEQLLEAATSGDRSALELLLAQCGTEIRGSLDINAKWRCVLDRDDVMQITYLEAFLGIEEFGGDLTAFRSWLRRMACNNLRDAIRGLERDKRPHPDQRLVPPPGQDSILWLYMQATSGGTSPSRKLARGEAAKILEAAMERLPPDYADVLRLRYFGELPLADVAAKMDRTYGAAYLLHERALEHLRRQVGAASRVFGVSS